MVHQHFMLIPTLTVAENIILGSRLPREPLLDIKDVKSRILELAKSYGLEVNPHAQVWQLSAGERQRVEILKALYRNADVLILDEPTSNLSPIETKKLFEVLERMREEGKGIIFITHKIYEALSISDRITVLRKGKIIGTVDREKAEEKRLVRMMVGHEVPQLYKREEVRAFKPVLRVQGLFVKGDMGVMAVKDVNLEVYSGEILGIAGVAGNGQSELVEAITGLRRVLKGKVIYDGVDITNFSPDKLYRMGIYHIPEKRIEMGVALDASVAENLILCTHTTYSDRFFLNYKAIYERAKQLIADYNIITPNEHSLVRTLSGGNIQKLIIARGISLSPKLLIANQPTAGLDIAASNFVHQKLLEMRDGGAAILLVSTDLDEIFQLCDRIAVIYKGEILGVVNTVETTREEIGLMMTGLKRRT